MLKFFRKIRQGLLSEGKTGKYLKYAIGEILLVIIGILIALWINNKNQDRGKEEKIKSTLVAIQNDIIQDTYYTKWLINRFIRKDSIYAKILDNQMDYHQLYDKELREIEDVSFHAISYNIQTNGYAQLMESLHELPEKYSHILTILNRLYKIQVDVIESMTEENVRIKYKYIDYLKYNQHWQAEDVYNGAVSHNQIEFYRNNPVFKSHVANFHWSVNEIMWAHSRYRELAMETYIKINEVLGKKDAEFPKEIRVTSVNTIEDAERLKGTYELISGPDNTKLGKKLKITSEGKDLYLSYVGQEEPRKLLSYHNEKPWFGIALTNILMRFETQGKNTLSINNGERAQTHWEKNK